MRASFRPVPVPRVCMCDRDDDVVFSIECVCHAYARGSYTWVFSESFSDSIFFTALFGRL